MRLLHLSDLHLGRRLFEVSLLEDQFHILSQILHMLDETPADGVILAGDLYDKAVPSAEAVRLLDWFLTQLAERDLLVLAISGNHDSAERLHFASRLLRSRQVHMAALFDGVEPPVVFWDSHGPVNVYLLPFIKPIHVRRCYPEETVETYTDAVKAVIDRWNPDPQQRNILVAHQLVTGSRRSESEVVSIGGLDDVNGAVLGCFDYVALGHLHTAQTMGERLHYCGTPLAYSFSESQPKSVTWVELGEKGSVRLEQTPLEPLRILRTEKGNFEELMRLPASEDFLRVILTDEDDVVHAMRRLQERFPNLLRLEYDNIRTRTQLQTELTQEELPDPLTLVEQFYEQQNGQPMSEAQRKLSMELIEKIWGDE